MRESFSVHPHYGYGETEAQPSCCTVVVIAMGIQPLLTLPVSVIKFPTESSLNEEGLCGSQLEGGWVGKSTEPCPSPHFLSNSARESGAWCMDGTAHI